MYFTPSVKSYFLKVVCTGSFSIRCLKQRAGGAKCRGAWEAKLLMNTGVCTENSDDTQSKQNKGRGRRWAGSGEGTESGCELAQRE